MRGTSFNVLFALAFVTLLFFVYTTRELKGTGEMNAGCDCPQGKEVSLPLVQRDAQVKRRNREFKIVEPFNFPQPAFSKPTTELLGSGWVTGLQEFLRTAHGNTISVVTSTVEHTDVLLNWLIAAYTRIDTPLQDVMVISMDANLHNLLVARNLPSLYVHKDMVVSPMADVPRVFSQVHVVRLAVVRLMNHYGYTVINYDCDAVPLKNLQPIFDVYNDTDLIGTFGKGPQLLYEKWGVTLNTGVMVMRATPNMEQFWRQMPYGKTPPITDDQNSINYCLEHMGLRWTNYQKTERIEGRGKNILGQVPLGGGGGGGRGEKSLSVMLMPYTTVCRHVCEPEKKDSYYVWHALAIRAMRTVANKKKQASIGGAWHLREDWERVSEQHPTLRGVEWLRHIAT